MKTQGLYYIYDEDFDTKVAALAQIKNLYNEKKNSGKRKHCKIDQTVCFKGEGCKNVLKLSIYNTDIIICQFLRKLTFNPIDEIMIIFLKIERTLICK